MAVHSPLLPAAKPGGHPRSVDINAELATLGENVDADDLERAVEEAREETSEQVYGPDT